MLKNNLSDKELSIISICISDFLKNLDEIAQNIESGLNLEDTLIMAEFIIKVFDNIHFENKDDSTYLKNQLYKIIWLIKEQQ